MLEHYKYLSDNYLYLVQLQTITGADPEEPILLDVYNPERFYGLRQVLIVKDESGQAQPSDSFDVKIAYKPAPANDSCENALPIELDQNGQATIEGSIEWATDLGGHLMGDPVFDPGRESRR